MANSTNNGWYSSEESDDEAKKSKPKFSKLDQFGELSSDDDDESNLKKLFKNKEDRKKLLNMTEKEREEEIFKRSMELNDLKSRQKAVKKLNEQKKTEYNQPSKANKRTLADVFSRCSDDESIASSSSIDSSTLPNKKQKVSSPQINPRQKALENQKSSKNAMLSLLHENRKQRQKRLEKLEKDKKGDVLKKSIFESDSSDSEEKKVNNIDSRLSIISSSSSEQMDGPNDEFEDKPVEAMEDLSKIRLSRHKLESWVHMPFFKDLIKGCFVRVNIGEGPAVLPIYRIAEIMEVVETVKIYDLGKTRTNVGLKLRIGNSTTMFRLLFVSNQSFMQAEFDSWRKRVISDGCLLPKNSFIERKVTHLKEYANFSISNEETMKQVLMSKQRFQKGPVNIALHKAELTRQKLAAENDGDMKKANEFQDEIDELNMKAEKLERKRTEGIKNISYINQRNRETTMEHVEKAIELEIAEKLEWDKKGGDPFVREPTKPMLNYRKKKQEQLEKAAQEGAEEAMTTAAPLIPEPVINRLVDPKINIINIHDFDLHLDIEVDGLNGGHRTQPLAKATVGNSSDSASMATNGSRRTLNLQDYKKRKGLI